MHPECTLITVPSLQVYICGMPHEYGEDEIREYWGFCGEIGERLLGWLGEAKIREYWG